ncbi:zinc finger and SCAN domain-containing protein 4-like [Trichechus manatus latirostris]|uniref:Zinc finger and SCAN domain-containing protein 4-like n=1 Tax=Trichechus manatus latirostris TaxID=127582 RepID=A0A2Y9E4E4_TRIMA|nr:zinc finger and SCAN domain-containing protein 4-like [Trichechus manatus latirostris]
MALDLRTSFRREPTRNDSGLANREFEPTQGTGVQKAEGISGLQGTPLSIFQYSNNSYARQELQRLQKLFHLWLQPEKHSKEEMISQLVLEQFMINEQCRNRSALKEKWDSSGRSLKNFLEDLTNDFMEPPAYVHVCMQGQEALCSENMPLRDAIVHLTKQLSAGTPTGENMGTLFQTPKDSPMQTGRGEDKENNSNLSLKTAQVNDSITSQGNRVPSLQIIQEENCPKPEEGGACWDNPEISRRAGLGTSRSQEGALGGLCHQDVLMEVEPGFISRPDLATPEPASAHRSNEGKFLGEGHQERIYETPKPYRCGDCPKIFRYFSQLKANQRRHRNERPCVCAECHKHFFETSELCVHQVIHRREKPFSCSTCDKSFSHRTNLRAHERIHMGEKPYMCSICKRSYRQSSTYHRHVKTHQKVTLKGVSNTTEAS